MDNVYYWRKNQPVQNFGDYLSVFFMEELFHPLGASKSCVFIGGSVIDDLFVPESSGQDAAQSPSVIFWGSGLRTKNGLSEGRRDSVQILSVRGPHSASNLRLGASVPQGDPGFLLPALYAPKHAPEFANKSLCIPHFHDPRTDEELLAFSGCDLVLRPNLSAHSSELRRFIDAIASADFVLSGAMHGAVTASAYGRPFAFWDSGEIDLPFKWQDIAAQLGIPCCFSSTLSEGLDQYHRSIKPALEIPSLISSLSKAPFLIRSSALLKVIRHELSHKSTLSIEAKLDAIVSLFEQQADRAGSAGLEIEKEYAEIEALLKKSQDAYVSANDTVADLRKELEFQRERNKSLERREIARLQALRYSFEESRSWKLTKPLRAISHNSPGLKRNVRRSVKLARYLVTFQFAPIKRKLAQVLRSDRARKIAPVADQLISQIRFAPMGGIIEKAVKPSLPLILIVDSVYPRPDSDSGSVDAVNSISAFQGLGYQVAFLSSAEFETDSPNRVALENNGVFCPSARDFKSIERVFDAIGPRVDVCILSRVHAGGAFMEQVRRKCPQSKVIFNTVDLHFLKEERAAVLKGDRKALNLALGTKEREVALMRLADATIVVSEAEHRLINEIAPGSLVFTVPLAREVVRRRSEFSARNGIGFIGGYLHSPNIDAVHYFLDSIWPKVRKKLPDATFYAMGADMPVSLLNRQEPGFFPLGHVSDLASALGKVRVMVAPLRVGAGAKGKVATSLAYGVPCVASPIAAEGMGLIDRETILIGDTPDSFADQVIDLHTNSEKWNLISDAGMVLMENRFSLKANQERLSEVLAAVNARAHAR